MPTSCWHFRYISNQIVVVTPWDPGRSLLLGLVHSKLLSWLRKLLLLTLSWVGQNINRIKTKEKMFLQICPPCTFQNNSWFLFFSSTYTELQSRPTCTKYLENAKCFGNLGHIANALLLQRFLTSWNPGRKIETRISEADLV